MHLNIETNSTKTHLDKTTPLIFLKFGLTISYMIAHLIESIKQDYKFNNVVFTINKFQPPLFAQLVIQENSIYCWVTVNHSAGRRYIIFNESYMFKCWHHDWRVILNLLKK